MTLTKIDDRGLKTPIDLLDNEKIRFGTGNDLEIFYHGSYGLIDNTANTLYIKSAGGTYFQNSGSEAGLYIKNNGAVELYYDNVKKFETVSQGISVTGAYYGSDWVKIQHDNKGFTSGASDDLQIYHDGTNSQLANSTGLLYLKGGGDWIVLQAENGENSLIAKQNGAVELYYDAVKKIETLSDGVSITGTAKCSTALWVGSGNDVQITRDGSDSKIQNFNGDFYLGNNGSANTLYLRARIDENSIVCHDDGAVELYHNNIKVFNTEANGIFVAGPEGGNSIVYMYADEGDDLADKWSLQATTSAEFTINYLNDSSAWEKSIECNRDGSVELYYDNSKKFETHATGGNFFPGSDATSVRVYGSNGSTVACTLGSTNNDEGFFRALDGGIMKTWVEARGIAFGGDTADVNFLDDYEEGNYSPTFTGSSGDYTLNGSFNQLQYTKIGRMVHISGRITMTSKNSATGDYIHMSLPTTSATLGEGRGRVTGTVIVQYSGKAINDYVVHPTQEGNSYVQLAHVDYDGTGFNSMNAQFSGDELVAVNITYASA